MIGIVYALVVLLAVTTGGLITFAILNNRSKSDLLAMRDRIEKQDEEYDTLEADRNGFKVELDAERKKTAVLTDRVAVAESQRNDAQRQMRDHVVEKLRKANVADANKFIAELLAAPLPDVLGVLQAVPRSSQPASGDGLMDPAEL